MTGKRLARSEFFDLIIIDINIPVINGYELCRAIRAFNMQVPILMLTALGSTENKLEGFEAGGDDYLVKPFEFLELLARIRALLKRVSNQPSQQMVLTIDNLELNTDTKLVKRGDRKIDLTAREFALLEYFLRNKGTGDIACRACRKNLGH
jgi:DNA-binding response OmpR family regulator